MEQILLAHEVDMRTWRAATRRHVHAATPPEALLWQVRNADGDNTPASTAGTNADDSVTLTIPRLLAHDLMVLLQSSAPERFALAYRLVYRVVHAGLDLTDAADADISRAKELIKDVVEETHHFRAVFSAFAMAATRRGLHYANRNYILEANAAFCKARYTSLWEVTAGYRRMLWNGRRLFFGPGQTEYARLTVSQWQAADEGVWAGSYPSLRLPPSAKDLAAAQTLSALSAAAMDCQSCGLWQPASRTVFGVGQGVSGIMFVGEQPGDQEDRVGVPFVGPAGQLLDKALHEVGITRTDAYVTNAVKHFNFVLRNGRRIHQKPDDAAMTACRAWLDAERRLVQPHLIVMLGATAAHSVLKRSVTIGRERSRIIRLEDGGNGLVTVHPSYLLRIPDEATKALEYARFVQDLTMARDFVAQQKAQGQVATSEISRNAPCSAADAGLSLF